MAYTNRYDYDIFISYSHEDDAEPSGRKGWVTEFREYLENWLVKKRGLKGLTIWIDDKLNGNTVFDRAIEDKISRSALFFCSSFSQLSGFRILPARTPMVL
jgi:hypothetical protein